jgi:hypothetical protein
MERLYEEAVASIPDATISAPSAAGNIFAMLCTPAKKK